MRSTLESALLWSLIDDFSNLSILDAVSGSSLQTSSVLRFSLALFKESIASLIIGGTSDYFSSFNFSSAWLSNSLAVCKWVNISGVGDGEGEGVVSSSGGSINGGKVGGVVSPQFETHTPGPTSGIGGRLWANERKGNNRKDNNEIRNDLIKK